MINILIVDDHAIVRKGLIQIIENSDSFYDIDEAENGMEVISKIRLKNYHIVILDMNMPGRNGLDVLQDIKLFNKDIKVLILSVNTEKQIVLRALKYGASGYLSKETIPDELIKAINKIYYGERYLSSSLAEQIVMDITDSSSSLPHEQLSDREHQTLIMIGSGKTVKTIADELFLSTKTISTYRKRIMEKMNFSNNLEIIRYVVENELITK